MSEESLTDRARLLEWLVRRNPMYLLSAVVMAFGAQRCLNSTGASPGDPVVIFTTLGILQAYELAVTGVLLLLHRASRAREDQPGLLLVAILFWMGPLAATMELTAYRLDLGIAFSLAVVVMAMAEFTFVSRVMRLPPRFASSCIAIVGLVLVGSLPPIVRAAQEAGYPGEPILFGAWWAFGVVVAAATYVIQPRPAGRERDMKHPPLSPAAELTFVGILLATVAGYLAAVNDAFFLHASWAYGAPPVLALAVVLFEYASVDKRVPAVFLLVPAALPVAAIVMAAQQPHEAVLMNHLPTLFRNPLLVTAPAAVLVWWFGYARHRVVALLHVANAVVVAGIVRLASARTLTAVEVNSAISAQTVVAFACVLVAAYLTVSALLRRSRLEGVLAAVAAYAGLVIAVWDRSNLDTPVILFASGWVFFIVVQLAFRKPRAAWQFIPVIYLIAVTLAYDGPTHAQWLARGHAVVTLMVLAAAGFMCKRSALLLGATLMAAAQVVFHGWHGLNSVLDTTTAIAVLISFALLGGGAWTSWTKHRLLDGMRSHTQVKPAERMP